MSEIEITGVFENVLGMIYSAKQKAEYQVNSTIIDLYWSIGEYVSKQIDVNGWGKSTVKALSEYILSKEPGIRGYSSQNIWRMKQFYETLLFDRELSLDTYVAGGRIFRKDGRILKKGTYEAQRRLERGCISPF